MLGHDLSAVPARLRAALALVAALGVTAALLAVATPPALAATKVNRAFFGLHDPTLDPDQPNGMPQVSFGAVRLWDAGVTWREIERSEGTYDWSLLDAHVAHAESRGVRPMYVFGGTPQFHAVDPTADAHRVPGSASVPHLKAYRTFVSAVAQRYGTRIEYQVWNEPNVKSFFTGTPRDAALMTRAAHQAVKAIAPKAKVVAPSFPIRHRSQWRWFKKYWKQELRTVPVSRYVNITSINPYPLADQGPEASLALIRKAQNFLRKRKVRKPLWNTEINYGLVGGGQHVEENSDLLQASWVMRTYLTNAGAGVKRVYWYRWDSQPIANTLLTEQDGFTPTTAGAAYARVGTWMTGARFQKCGTLAKGVWRCSATTATHRKLFYWKPSGRARVTLPKGARKVVAMDGTERRVTGGTRIRVTKSVVMVLVRR